MEDKRSRIIASARKMFEMKGFKKTKISNIMTEAGMATGTFYNYFTSKEEVFMLLYNEENMKLKQTILDKTDLSGHPTEVMQILMMRNEAGMKGNPILREWYNPDVAGKMEKYFRESDGLDQLDFMYGTFKELIEGWQTQEIVRKDITVETIMGMFTSLIVLETHKDELGIHDFEDVMTWLLRFTMEGILVKG